MKRMVWAVVLLLVLVPMLLSAADEVRFGTTVAYWYPGDVVRVPVIVSNDSLLSAWGVAFRIPSGAVVIDSVTPSGRLAPTTPIIIFTIVNDRCTNPAPGVAMDSGFLLCALAGPDLEIGAGEVCSIWLHGLPIGSQLSFDLPAALQPVDSTTCVADQRTLFLTRFSSQIYPARYSTSLLVVEAPLEITAPVVASGHTLVKLSIPIEINSFFGDPTLSVLSFIGPTGTVPFPTVTGSGTSWAVEWTPGLHGDGAYMLTIRAVNDHGQEIQKSIAIAITPSVLSGDIDCNGNVDLSDLTRMINWMVNHTLPPVCP